MIQTLILAASLVCRLTTAHAAAPDRQQTARLVKVEW